MDGDRPALGSRFVLKNDPFCEWTEGVSMEFWLNYVGVLPKTASVALKHSVRRDFHKQLKLLWKRHPALQAARHGRVLAAPDIAADTLLRDGLAQRYVSHGGYAWVPLVRGEAALFCSIEILMLRMDLPGGHIRSPDLDNWAKLLIDAMTIPNAGISQEALGGLPSEDEKPFFVLLEDDKWVTRIVVDSANLLVPVDTKDENHMQAVIKVTLKPQYRTGTNMFVV
jgi:hypothetical protein